jgi:short-subunit dehydrogenase
MSRGMAKGAGGMKLFGCSGQTKNKLLKSSVCAVAAGIGLIVAAKRMRRRSLAGRVALITGGSRGLGLELARKLSAQGCRLILVARDREELARVKNELSSQGTEVRTIACDLTDETALSRMVEEARRLFGRIDILINDAGAISVGPIEAFSEADFKRAMDLMFWAGFRTTMALLPDFLSSGDADIVNITSIGGKIPMPHLLPYATAKFAMTGFSEGLSAEIRNRGVHILTVTPGLMRTGAHLQAEFAGNQRKEYQWFAAGASIPGFSMQISRAARQIVNALIDRKKEIVLTVAARSAARVFGSFPGPALKLLESVNNYILPGPSNDSTRRSGKELHSSQSAALRGVTIFGTRAAKAQNQF